MRFLNATLALLLLISLTACEGNSRSVYHSDTPELLGFYVIDSDGVSSEFAQDEPMIIDPYTQDGFFDVYWYASSFYDYQVYLSVNDRPGLVGAIYIKDDLCGIDSFCDHDGSYMCQYTADYYLACGLDVPEIESTYVDVRSLIDTIPDNLFLNFEVCNTSDRYCEIQSVPVRMY